MTDESQLSLRAATFDELLGDGFAASIDEGTERGSAAHARLAAWCRTSAHDDWALFESRIARDGWDRSFVEARLGSAAPCGNLPPQWVDDVCWIRAALDQRSVGQLVTSAPFGHVFTRVVDAADERVPYPDIVAAPARDGIRLQLLDELTRLCAPALFDYFRASGLAYPDFVAAVDLDALWDEKPVLLRLVAVLTRQWVDSSTAFCQRLSTDETVVRDLAGTSPSSTVVAVVGGLSDRHRGGRSVLRLEFGDGSNVLYKPKDIRVDAAWCSLIGLLNAQHPPAKLRAVNVVSRPGYGWAEFVEHAECSDQQFVSVYFRRAGALLALLHCLAAADMHHENIIACGDQPVPVDLEAILQGSDDRHNENSSHSAQSAARDLIAESVLFVGLLPGYARIPGRQFIPVGGLANGWSTMRQTHWKDVNSHSMRPEATHHVSPLSNLPYFDGKYGTLEEHLDVFLAGFTEYSKFLMKRDWSEPLAQFSDVVVRNVHRPTQFYLLLLDRLRDDRTMNDGAQWSVQADFLARLADWDVDDDPLWGIQRHERDALLELDVPFFEASSEGGLRRARDRIAKLDDQQVGWQCDLIRQTSSFLGSSSAAAYGWSDEVGPLSHSELLDESDAISEYLARCAIRRGPGAAWLGLNWLPESETAQPAVLGNDLYSGNCGIALFLAAYSRVRRCPASSELALAALTAVRADINGGNISRISRGLGIGGATGLGSVTYALAVIAAILEDDSLLGDSERAAELITDDLITADIRFDVVGGAAGAALGLLRLHRDISSPQILRRAQQCGEHLLSQRPVTADSMAGMSHGAAGFAYALAALSAATGCSRYADEAQRWLDVERRHRRAGADRQPQWCHGATGTGLALMAMAAAGLPNGALREDINGALGIAEHTWPDRVDTLCCGTLGNIELLLAAGRREAALQRFSAVVNSKDCRGGYRWSGGSTRFNVGLFRGLAGVGYTCLRLLDDSLPNVLVWE